MPIAVSVAVTNLLLKSARRPDKLDICRTGAGPGARKSLGIGVVGCRRSCVLQHPEQIAVTIEGFLFEYVAGAVVVVDKATLFFRFIDPVVFPALENRLLIMFSCEMTGAVDDFHLLDVAAAAREAEAQLALPRGRLANPPQAVRQAAPTHHVRVVLDLGPIVSIPVPDAGASDRQKNRGKAEGHGG